MCKRCGGRTYPDIQFGIESDTCIICGDTTYPSYPRREPSKKELALGVSRHWDKTFKELQVGG